MGVSVYTAPSVKNNHQFFYFDPLNSLSDDVKKIWMNTDESNKILIEIAQEAIRNQR